MIHASGMYRARAGAMAGFALLLGLVLGPVQAVAQDISDTLDICMSCHGETGQPTTNGVPSLVGRSAEDLAAQLRRFRSGERSNPSMAMAKRLTDAEIQQLAEYYAEHTPK